LLACSMSPSSFWMHAACLDKDRKTVNVYDNEPGEIKIIQFSTRTLIAIAPERVGQHMISDIVQMGNSLVPDGIEKLKDGDKIYFSGELKEAYTTENMPGNFFKLTTLKAKVQGNVQSLSVG